MLKKIQRKTKRVNAQVYSVVLKNMEGAIYLWSGVSFSLDEALVKAKLAALLRTPNAQWQLILFESISLEQIDKTLEKPLVSPKKKREKLITMPMPKISDKNMLMKEIIEGHDIKLFEKYKNKFNVIEKKFLRDSLNKGNGLGK